MIKLMSVPSYLINVGPLCHAVVEHKALNRENPGLTPIAVVSKLWQFYSPHIATVHSAVNEYLATGSGGYANEYLCAIITAWLNASQRSRDGIGMNRSARG